jgi:hypothetical protein
VILFRIYAVLALVQGERVTAADVHDAWSAWMCGEDPSHPSLKPSAELAPDIRVQDEPYVAAIRAVARARGLDGR